MVLVRYRLLETLTGSGPQRYGASPFGGGRLSINLERSVWNDSAGRPEIDGKVVAGNVIGFVQAKEQCSFRDALFWLHREFGDAPQDAAAETRGQVAQALRSAEAEDTSPNVPFGKELGGLRTDVPFLTDMGLAESTLKEFGVGYCSRGLMKGRIVFPIHDSGGAITAYVGRALKESDPIQWKYPAGFKTKLELLGADRLVRDAKTRKAVGDYGVILVPDFFDLLWLWQNGFTNVVSLMNEHVLYPVQREMLLDPKFNPTRRISLFFHNTEEGRKATTAIAERLLDRAFVRLVDYGRAMPVENADVQKSAIAFDKARLTDLLRIG